MVITVIAKRKPEQNSGLNGIRTHDLCDTGAVLYQWATNWKPAGSWSFYEFSYIHFQAEFIGQK